MSNVTVAKLCVAVGLLAAAVLWVTQGFAWLVAAAFVVAAVAVAVVALRERHGDERTPASFHSEWRRGGSG